MGTIDREVKGHWAMMEKAENEATYESTDDLWCWYCGGALDGLNLVHYIGSDTWHLRCVVKELERRRLEVWDYGRESLAKGL